MAHKSGVDFITEIGFDSSKAIAPIIILYVYRQNWTHKIRRCPYLTSKSQAACCVLRKTDQSLRPGRLQFCWIETKVRKNVKLSWIKTRRSLGPVMCTPTESCVCWWWWWANAQLISIGDIGCYLCTFEETIDWYRKNLKLQSLMAFKWGCAFPLIWRTDDGHYFRVSNKR